MNYMENLEYGVCASPHIHETINLTATLFQYSGSIFLEGWSKHWKKFLFAGFSLFMNRFSLKVPSQFCFLISLIDITSLYRLKLAEHFIRKLEHSDNFHDELLLQKIIPYFSVLF